MHNHPEQRFDSSATPVADGLDSAMERLQNTAFRVRKIEERIARITTRIHGPAPREVSGSGMLGDSKQSSPPASIHYLLQMLENALDSCEGELGRL